MEWYKTTPSDLHTALASSDKGLTDAEAERRIRRYGPNRLAVHKEPWWRVVIAPFRDIFVAVLTIAAAVSLLNHEVLDAVVIAAVIATDAIIFYTQQFATTRVLRSLKQHNQQYVRVVRGGQVQTVPAEALVPGDRIVLAEGERVPADARLVTCDALQTNESALTGESTAVRKQTETFTSSKQLYEQTNMVFQGTYVLTGTAQAVVTATGAQTEFGKIAALAATERAQSPVQHKIDQLISRMVQGVAVLSGAVFVLALLRGTPPSEALRFVLSLAVSAVPEGLPVALTVIIVLGMRRMAREQALVRVFRAIEDIGLVTTIATDKTGTLTKNHLTVVETWQPASTAPSAAEPLQALALRTLDLAAHQTDPLDKAIAECAPRTVPSRSRHTPDKLYPFDLQYRMSGAYYRPLETLYIKGAPEQLLRLARLSPSHHTQAEAAVLGMAAKGFRVIAFGSHAVRSPQPPADLGVLQPGDVVFAGLMAFADELRPEAATAVKAAHDAGISVRLITGDHADTAFHIGTQIGVATRREQVIEGTALPRSTAALAAAIRDKTVFARILPEDKFRLLTALQRTEIAAMTGDGVNDVPALTRAHVGIAMGSGSDIARDAGGIILLNDNFATIVRAIAEGRTIFDNIRRMLFYLLSTSLGEVLTMIGALMVGLPLPVTAIQILWVNLVTDTAMVLPLGLEPAEDGAMQRPPRRPHEPLFQRALVVRMALVALTMAVVTLVLVGILLRRGYSTPEIQTVAFLALITAQWMNAFNARSENDSSFRRLTRPNYGLAVGFLLAVGLQCLVMFGPLQTAFGVVSVPLGTLLWSSGIMMLAVLLVSEIHKWASRSTVPRLRGPHENNREKRSV